ncbi:MAG: arginase family protein [Deltaproteobacteria bacterium]|nr:arginase family protein [Deltaproteobacteria bacterium]
MDNRMQNQIIFSPYFIDEPLPDLESLARPNWQLNTIDLPAGKKMDAMAAVHRPLADFTEQSIRSGSRPVSIAGDCCSAIGMAAGVQRAGLNPVLIWFDAHGDFNTRETTPSGFLGGMPLAMLTGRGDQTMLKALGLKPIPDARVVLTDARDLDPGEKELLGASGVTHLQNVRDLINHPLPDGPLYVHVDTNVVDPDEAPAMNYVAAGGPSAADLDPVFEHLNLSGKLAAVSVSTWNPGLDTDGKSRKVCMHLLDTLIGSQSGYPSKSEIHG